MTDLQVLQFNARALTENSKIQFALNKYGGGWHLQTCIPYHDCMCADLLDDPGRIFDYTPTNVPIQESIKYFMTLSRSNGRNYVMRDNGHLHNCIYAPNCKNFRGDQSYECACDMVRKNPEQFFKIPLQDRFKFPMPSEVQNLRNEWDESESYCKIKKFNILCRVLGKTCKIVLTHTGHHLTTCTWSWANNGPCCCHCSNAVFHPETFFLQQMDGDKFKIYGEDVMHSKDCVRVKALHNPYDCFPKSLKCTCHFVEK